MRGPWPKSQTRRCLALIVTIAVLFAGQVATRTDGAFSATTSGATSVSTVSSYACNSSYNHRVQATSGVLNYWRLGEMSGTAVADSVGSITGTYRNGVLLNQTPARNSMNGNPSVTMDGVDDFIQTGDFNDFTGTSTYTLEAWVKRTSASTSFQYVLDKELFSPQRDGWGLYIASESLGYVIGTSRTQNGTLTQAVSTTRMELNRWYHVAATHTAGAAGLKLYVNGELEGQTNSTLSLADTTANLTMGIPSTGGTPAKIGLDDVSIYSTALSPAEIKAHYDGCYGNVIMSDDFGSGSSWDTARWDESATLGATSSVSGGVGVMTQSNTSNNSLMQSADATYGTAFTDQGVTFKHRFGTLGAGSVARFGVRCSTAYDGNAPTDCYWLELTGASGGTIQLVATKAGGGSTSAASATVADTNWWNYRVEVNGQNLRFKRWADGTAEPVAWGLTYAVPASRQRTTGTMLLEAKRYNGPGSLPVQNFDDVNWYSLP